ncbi:hypothetical protein J3R30DRAFT_2393449 [Lentinula aciculospora]|uniref:C2H2-type domain-containing protein n=1 Tax=Lentinula aciculospora TaxID=153920 RepID=A0A9W9AFT6_9AGAR|nr:hypothetical protein J3R30DRAFT_2393449 [Lentinula aciculospora]
MSLVSSSISSTAIMGTTLPGAGVSPSQSLLSLSIAASNVAPIPISSSMDSSVSDSGPTLSSAISTSINGNSGSSRNQRRLSSAGNARRRLSDARDAATRPLPTALSLATLSLSLPSTHSLAVAHAPSVAPGRGGISTFAASLSESPVAHSGIPTNSPSQSVDIIGSAPASAPAVMSQTINSKPISIKNGKKRGIEHKCEGCSKIYRHPSCLIKHRWEHTPHWRESSKYVLSKHQQVQLLEAAAILSHLSAESATGTSLPEDRSLWPSFLSGGSLPLPEGNPGAPNVTSSMVSNSVPASNVLRSASASSGTTPARPPSVGPRLHDYTVPTTDVTQVRPGLYMMGGSSVPSSAISPIAISPNDSYSEVRSLGPGIGYGRAVSLSSSSGDSPPPQGARPNGPRATVSSFAPSSSSYDSTSLSIPRSSLRSGSVFSESERSSSLEEEEDDEDHHMQEYHDYEFELDVDIDGDDALDISGRKRDVYAFSDRGDKEKRNFDEYGFEYERGFNMGISPAKVATPALGLDSMKEEDWEMEMDMD